MEAGGDGSGSEPESWEGELATAEEQPKWQLKKLKPIHKQIAALLAQGKKQVDVARLCQVHVVYVSMLSRQPLVQNYIYDMVAAAGMQLEASFPLVVEVIQETLKDGSEAGKLKAARLHLEATKRIGRNELTLRPTEDAVAALENLAGRLMALQTRAENQRSGSTFTQDGEPVQDVP
jgi:hypothetical protein